MGQQRSVCLHTTDRAANQCDTMEKEFALDRCVSGPVARGFQTTGNRSKSRRRRDQNESGEHLPARGKRQKTE